MKPMEVEIVFDTFYQAMDVHKKLFDMIRETRVCNIC